jgi:IS1 family transposase
MGHDLKNTWCKCWLWNAVDQDTGQLLDWACGRCDKKALKKTGDRLAPWDIDMSGTDTWATGVSCIPPDTLV